MNLPNKITIVRILLIPVFMIVMLLPDWGEFKIDDISIPINHIVGTIIFVTAAITDGIDGYIARKHNLITNLGKFLDPIADKLLVAVALIVLIDIGYTNSWFVAIILAREFAVTGFRLVLAGEGEILAASRLGKMKTLFQFMAIVISLINNFPFSLIGIPVAQVLMIVAVMFSVWSGLDIFWTNRQIFLTSK